MIQVAALCLVLVAPAQVQMRGGEAPPEGQVVAVDAAGVLLGAGAATKPTGQPGATGAAPQAWTVLVGWDRIKSVQGPMADEAAKFGEVADLAWRARTRLERGDFVAAEPLFERLFEYYKGQDGPTAAMVAEGLLRCRVHRAAHVAAVEPWLAYLKASAPGRTKTLHAAWSIEAGLPPIIDAATGLVPALPPIWLSWPSVDAYVRGSLLPGASEGEHAKGEIAGSKGAALAALYEQAARFEAGLPATIPEVNSADPGAQLVLQILRSRIGDAAAREDARAALRERLRPPTGAGDAPKPAWVDAWCHAAIGRSLLREDSPESKKLGVVELLHVPAAYGRLHPYLAGVALAESSAALRAMGDKTGADVLARELMRNYPGHPVVDWAPVRPFLPRPQSLVKPASGVSPDPPLLPPDPGPKPEGR